MGHVIKVILSFHAAFWEGRGLRKLSFLHARGERFPTWWTTRPLSSPILVGWAGGPSAEALALGDGLYARCRNGIVGERAKDELA
jgi:hypothetical protein